MMIKKNHLVAWHYGTKVAMVEENGSVVTYGELQKNTVEFSENLETRKLLFLVGANDILSITAYIACIEKGIVPLLLDYGISDTSLKKLIEIYQPTYVFIPKKRFNNLNNFKFKKIYEEYVLLEQETKCAKKLNDALALLLPTSGSTGSPKLVRLSFENIASNSKSIIQYLKLNELDRAITSLPFTYSYGLSVINSHLAVGATLVLTNSSLIESKFWKLLSEYGVTSMAGVPFSYKMLLRLKFEEMNLPSLRLLTQAGGKMPIEDLTKITSICAIKKIDFYTMYGQTEASPRIAYLEPAQLSSRLGSIGKAIPSGELWLENKNGVRINESNVKGELVYKGKNVA